MSMQLFHQDILFLQRLLRSAGFYQGKLDGIYGPKTSKAEEEFIFRTSTIEAGIGVLPNVASETAIYSLHPEAQRAARKLYRECRKRSISIRIISGTRSYREQDNLYAIGRSIKGTKVTNAKGGQSNHNFGIAFDIGVFEEGKYLVESPLYNTVGEIGKGLGLEWGGDWKTIKDRPHFQLKTGLGVSEVRRRFEAGEKFV